MSDTNHEETADQSPEIKPESPAPAHDAEEFVSIAPNFESASQDETESNAAASVDPRDEMIRKLQEEIADLKLKTQLAPGEGNQTPDGLRRQYETKLKDVMDKAREHARKLAQDRDEQRKLNEEKEAKLSQYKQLMAAANTQLEERDSTIRDLEKAEAHQKQIVEKLTNQMKSMENHYTKPPTGPIEASLSVSDQSGMEWLLVGERWWARRLINGQASVKHSLSMSQIRELEAEITRLKTAVDSSTNELLEYKRKVEKVLKEKSELSVSLKSPDAEAGVESARKILKLEAEISQQQTTIEGLRKQISSLQSSERNLLSQVSAAKAELSRLVDPVNKMEAQIVELRSEKKVLNEKLAVARSTISELTSELDSTRLANAVQQNLKPATAADNSVQPNSILKLDVHSVAVQTDLLPAILRSDHVPQTNTPKPEAVQTPSRTELVNQQHDAVALPLRQQIKDLIIELESEKHEHSMTIAQLQVVKEELRKLEAQRKLGSDLTDPVKVEYMRNVARRFIALAPHTGSDEFEQLVPVILNFFGLEGDEAIALMKERRKRVQESSNLTFPKLW